MVVFAEWSVESIAVFVNSPPWTDYAVRTWLLADDFDKGGQGRVLKFIYNCGYPYHVPSLGKLGPSLERRTDMQLIYTMYNTYSSKIDIEHTRRTGKLLDSGWAIR